MSGPTFQESISGNYTIPAPQASNGGTINFNFNHNDPGQPQPSEPTLPFSTVPFLPDNDFIERPIISAWLRDKCDRPGSRTALIGLGGVGKSQLAIRYAHQVHEQSPDTYVLWVHASTHARFEEAYRRIADLLQLPRRHDPNTDVLRLVCDWLSRDKMGKWLLIIDNADDINIFYPRTYDPSSTQLPLASYLPQCNNGRILITSRNSRAAEKLTGGSRNIISIPAMDEIQAKQLLRIKLGDRYDEHVASDMVHALERIPLAITQAAAYITWPASQTSPSEYLVKFRASDKKKASLLNKGMGDLRRDPTAMNSVVTTWQITFEQIQRERQSAADLLLFMSFFNQQGIPKWVLQRYQRAHEEKTSSNSSEWAECDSEDEREDDEFDDDMEILCGYSLVAVTTQNGVFEMHALVQLCTRVWLSSINRVEEWRSKYLHVMSTEYPSGEYVNWIKCRELDPHVESVLDMKPHGDEAAKDWAHLMTYAGWYGLRVGKYQVAERRLRKAVSMYEKLYDEENLERIFCVANLALVLERQGNYGEAEQISRRVLNSYKKAFGENHLATFTVISSLALVLYSQGKYDEAEPLERQALDAREKQLGRDHLDTLESVTKLGLVLVEKGRYDEAEKLHRRALDGFEKVLGPDHPNTLTVISSLALTLKHQKNHDAAEKMNRRSLAGYEMVLGKEHPYTLTSVSNLAMTLCDQGKYDEAEHLSRRALLGREEALGSEHPRTVISAKNHAMILQIRGKYEEAEPLYRRSIDALEKSLGRDNPETLMSIYWLAHLYHKQNRLDEACELFQRAVDGLTEALGENHPTVLECKSDYDTIQKYKA